MKSFSNYCLTLSTIFLASCGVDSAKGPGFSAGSNQEPQAASQRASEEQGYLSFDLSGVQIESESGGSNLSLTSLPRPVPNPTLGFTFVFTLTGTNSGENWVRKIEFPFEQKDIVIDKIPVGKVAVDLKLVNQEKMPTKGASGEATIIKDTKATLTLILGKLPPQTDSGGLVVTVHDDKPIGRCYQRPTPRCALPAPGVVLLSQKCSITISGKLYEKTVGWCAARVEFANWLCTQGVALEDDDLLGITCKDAI